MSSKDSIFKLKEAYPEIFDGLMEAECGFDYVFTSKQRYVRIGLAPRTGSVSSLLLITFDKPISNRLVSNRLVKSKKLNSNIAVFSELYRNKVPHCAISIGCIYSGVPIWEIVRSNICAEGAIYFSKHMFKDEACFNTIVGFEDFITNLSSENQTLLLKNISIISTVKVLNREFFGTSN